jgi:hypothetical protein
MPDLNGICDRKFSAGVRAQLVIETVLGPELMLVRDGETFSANPEGTRVKSRVLVPNALEAVTVTVPLLSSP